MTRSGCAWRRLGAVVTLLSLAGLAAAQPPSKEALAVSGQVLDRGDWRALALRCPASLMPQVQSLVYLGRKQCQPGQMQSCLAQCAQNDAGACYWLAEALQEAHVASQASEVLFQRACQLGVVSGCTNRAAGLFEKRRDDVEVQACAARTYDKACQADDPWACTMQALHLSRGLGVRQDRQQALKVLEKSCKYGPEDPACTYGQRLKASIVNDAASPAK